MQMKLPPFFQKLSWLGFIIILFSACSSTSTVQDDNYVPDNKAADINLQLGIEYMRRGRNDIALNKLQKALILDKNYAEAHNAIAVLYQRLGLTQEATQHYQTAVSIKPKGSDIHNNFGQFLCEQGQWKKAEQHFLKALENPVYQTPEIPYTNAALCALQHKHINQAETYLRKALQKNPQFPRTLYQMSQLNYEQEHYQQARNYLQRYLKVAEHTPQTLWLGIQIERVLKNKDTEASYAFLLQSKFPDAVETQLLNQPR
jgi:type IV pilus assembly protein PilF